MYEILSNFKTFVKSLKIPYDKIVRKAINAIFSVETGINSGKIYFLLIMTGLLLVLAGMYISIYNSEPRKIRSKSVSAKLKNVTLIFEIIARRYPFRWLVGRLTNSVSCFAIEEVSQKRLPAFLAVFLPSIGIYAYFLINPGLDLWYTKLIMLILCISMPYYIFTLISDYVKYSMRLKIPNLIDSFRSSFMTQYRIKPALQQCGKNIDKRLGRIILRASDSSDINTSLYNIRKKVDDTWFNIFVLLIVNYRENGGELIAQLYKLNRSITRYNNVEKKKKKRLIWYEVFTVLASIFSIPAIVFMNRLILGMDSSAYFDTTSAFTKVMIYSLFALGVIRLLRKM